MPKSPSRGVSIRFTENFASNLEGIRSFLDEADAADAFDLLVQRLFEEVVANLRQFPSLGGALLPRKPSSAEAHALHRRLSALAGERYQIRQYVVGEYLLLYAFAPLPKTVFLLAIRHHRQLSFDFRGHWE